MADLLIKRTCPACGEVLPKGVRAEFCPVCALRDARDPAPGIEVLGDYELIEEIGRGGMGVVWRARQRSLRRIVAVKVVLGGDFANASARGRFRTEAQAAARLQHPHIVAIHEIGEHDGMPFFSMDYVDGCTLADLARVEPLPARRAAEIVRTIAAAVQHAHDHGVLHLDLKPSNVLIDASGAPRITDFGLAKLLDVDVQLTMSVQAFGSPAYMPPEQVRRDPPTPASDVYAIGAILYHLLTGRPPFQGDSIATVLAQVENAEPLAPRRLNPSLAADLQNICLKCLEKNPMRRYITAQLLADDLARFLAGRPVEARPIGAFGVAWRWSRRHPALAGLWTALAALALISSVAAFSVHRANLRGRASLRDSLVAQAHAIRLAALPGHRARTLEVVSGAMALGPDPSERIRLRSEFIASLSLLDANFEAAPTLPSMPDLTRVAFDADHELCAYATVPQGPVIVCRLRDGAELHRFSCAPRRVWNIIAFSPDRRFLLMRDRQNLSVFEVATGRLCVERAAGLGQGSFAPDSSGVAIAGRDEHVTIFSLSSGRELRSWASKVDAIACSPDGTLLACATATGIELREFATGTLRQTLPGTGRINALAWSASGARLAAGAVSAEITLWNVDTGTFIRRFDGHHGKVRSLAFDVTDSLLASASDDDTVRLWELTSQRPALSTSVQSYGLSFSRDGHQLGPVWVFGPTGVLALERPDGFASLRAEPAVESRFSVAWSPDGRWLAAASAEGVRVWEAKSHRLLSSERVVTETVAFDPRGRLLAAGTSKGVRRYALPDDPGHALPLVDRLFERDLCPGVGFSLDGTRFAVARDARDTVDVFPPDDVSRSVSFRGGFQSTAVALSRDGRLVAASAEWGPDRVWVSDTANGHRVAELVTEGAQRTAFSPDGRWLATFGTQPQLWDVATWKSAARIDRGLRNELAGGGTFSPDGKLFAVLLGPGIPHLFALSLGREPEWLVAFESQAAPRLRALAFSPDGGRLAGAGPLGQVEVWDIHALRTHLRERGLDW